jgi:hypothetical protein
MHILESKKSKMFVPRNLPKQMKQITDIYILLGRYGNAQNIPPRPSAIEAEEAEEIGVEHLCDIKDSTTTTLATRVSEQLASFRGLQSRLFEIQKSLADVAAGSISVNHQIIYHLWDVLNLV